jgi:hypothetical protein
MFVFANYEARHGIPYHKIKPVPMTSRYFKVTLQYTGDCLADCVWVMAVE